jgi:Arc/MetJ-type ribon-helix-helix transcriptional regulator
MTDLTPPSARWHDLPDGEARIRVRVTTDFANHLDQLVEVGLYQNTTELLRDGIRHVLANPTASVPHQIATDATRTDRITARIPSQMQAAITDLVASGHYRTALRTMLATYRNIAVAPTDKCRPLADGRGGGCE